MSPETADVIRHAADIVQWINLAAALAILALGLEFGRRWRAARPYLLGPITWAAHSAVFYGVVLSARLSGPVTSLWSAVLRLHGYLILLALLLAAFAVALAPVPPEDYGEDYGDETDE